MNWSSFVRARAQAPWGTPSRTILDFGPPEIFSEAIRSHRDLSSSCLSYKLKGRLADGWGRSQYAAAVGRGDYVL